jgi:hypothetical protein
MDRMDRQEIEQFNTGEWGNDFDGTQENGGDSCEGNGERLLTESPSNIEQGFNAKAIRNRALKSIRKAAASQNEEGGFLGQHLRDRGIL